MVDANKLLVDYLRQDHSLAVALGNAPNVFAPVLPDGFDVRDGLNALVVAGRGGDAHAEIVGWKTERVQVTTWSLTAIEARTIYGLVFDYLQSAQNVDRTPNGFLVSALEVISGQDIVDPETGWNTCVGFFHVTVRP